MLVVMAMVHFDWLVHLICINHETMPTCPSISLDNNNNNNSSSNSNDNDYCVKD